jgi:hypothetical protein
VTFVILAVVLKDWLVGSMITTVSVAEPVCVVVTAIDPLVCVTVMVGRVTELVG